MSAQCYACCVGQACPSHPPDAYVDEQIDGAVMWTSASSEPGEIAHIQRVVDQALGNVERVLEFRRTRTVLSTCLQ